MISTISDCTSVSTFTSLVGVHVGVMGSALESKIYVLAFRIKKQNPVIKKKKKNDKSWQIK